MNTRARAAATLLASALLVLAPPMAAQLPDAGVAADEDAAHAGLAASERIARAESRVAADPMSYDARWRAAEAYAEISVTVSDEEAREELSRRGHEHAAGATAVDSEGLEGHYWLAVSAGLLADMTGGRSKVRFGDEVYRESSWVLAADSLHAGAHYLQGRVHAGVMRLNSATRFLAKLLLGGDALASASWEKAEYHLRRAAELQPGLPMHHFELAMVYEAMEWPDHRRRALQNALQTTTTSPFQAQFELRARELLQAEEASYVGAK